MDFNREKLKLSDDEFVEDSEKIREALKQFTKH
jgi:hypothetical protein